MKFSIATLKTNSNGRTMVSVKMSERPITFFLFNVAECNQAGKTYGDNILVKFSPEYQFAHFVDTNKIKSVKVK